MPAALTREQAAHRLEVLRIHNGNAASAARALGMKPGTLREWLNGIDTNAGIPEELPTPPIPAMSPLEVRDARFWQAKAQQAEKEARDAEHIAQCLAGVRAVPIEREAFADAEPSATGRSIMIVHTSDVHMGEVVTLDETHGLNEYNPDIARRRMAQLFTAACEIGPRWMVGTRCIGALLTMGGDLISGDIHEELSQTNALTSHESVKAVVQVYDEGIRRLLEAFGRVHVAAVPGNHGRTTIKPPHKRLGALSYDILAADMLRDRWADDKRVTWQIANAADVEVEAIGRRILVTHGDKMGTGGGQGFAGPMLPIVRGTAKIAQQASASGRAADVLLTGHYHTSGNPPGVLANGSVIGTNGYSVSNRMRPDVPRQWIARFSERHGLCDRLDVQLT
jgi:predicted phosphodiesterase